MKLAYFVIDQHAMSQWLIKWSEQLEKGSGGRITVKRFPAAQMGPTPGHYDFARTGQADASWFLHGGTPGRFPLTEIVNLPFMVGSAEIGTKVLNDTELRARYLDGEHKGVKLLLRSPTSRAARTPQEGHRRWTISRACGCALPPLRCATSCSARRHAGRRAAD